MPVITRRRRRLADDERRADQTPSAPATCHRARSSWCSGARHHAHLHEGRGSGAHGRGRGAGQERHRSVPGARAALVPMNSAVPSGSAAPVLSVQHWHRAQRHGVVGVDEVISMPQAWYRRCASSMPPLIDLRRATRLRRIGLPAAAEDDAATARPATGRDAAPPPPSRSASRPVTSPRPATVAPTSSVRYAWAAARSAQRLPEL